MRGLLNRILNRPSIDAVNDFEILNGGNPASRNILIFTEHINATYFIGFDIPLRRLHAQGKVNFAVVSQKHVQAKGIGCWERWADFFRPDVVVLTRYGQPYGADILDFFHRQGVRVIYHIDDNLLDIPDSLGTEIRQRQGATGMIDARRYLLGNCDLIYASTSHLATTLQMQFPTQRVFHGINTPYMEDHIQVTKRMRPSHPVVGYMGSKGHQNDLELVVPALEQLMCERPSLHFEVFGTIRMPKLLESFGNRVHCWDVQKSYMNFLATLASLNWDIGLAPLADEPFNRCKAPTKFIEYTAAGIPLIATEMPVYRNAVPDGGGLLVQGDWHSAISTLLDSPQARADAVLIAQRHCAKAFAVGALERQLLYLFAQV